MEIFESSKQTYGSPKVTRKLRAMGRRVSKKHIANMMRAADIRARKPRRYIVTTDSKHNYPIVPNVLQRQFLATRECEIWISDITYVRTNSGWLYLTVIIDMFDRKVVGWSMSTSLSAEQTVMPAWFMATKARPITQALRMGKAGLSTTSGLNVFGKTS